MTKAEVCSTLRMSVRALEMLVADGRFPPGRRLGRCVYWTQRAVDEFVRREFAVQEAFWTAR